MVTRRGARSILTRAGLRTVAAAILPGLRPILCAVIARGGLALTCKANAAKAIRRARAILPILTEKLTFRAPAVLAGLTVVLCAVRMRGWLANQIDATV